MHNVSTKYKNAMRQYLRPRGYVTVGLGVVNQEAQASAKIDTDGSYWSNSINPFLKSKTITDYATLEENFCKCDGSQTFLPRNDEYMQLESTCYISNNILESVLITFSNKYSIKGITIDFGDAYPTSLQIITEKKNLSYTNDNSNFSTSDVLGETSYVIIKPISMVGGNQRLRLNYILMGVGLVFKNEELSNTSYTDFSSGISAELPYKKLTLNVIDYDGTYDVDNDNSFINFLEEGQNVNVSYGIEIDDNTIEWVKVARLGLNSWSSKRGSMTLTCEDTLGRFTQEYSIGNKIYTRTAYEEAESIFEDMGLEPDEYSIDYYMKDIVITNPMPKNTHVECLQMLCNACRCILKQNENGVIKIIANFETSVDPEEIDVEANTNIAAWSHVRNVLDISNIVYADMTRNFVRADGKQFFLPKDEEDYIDGTGYVSNTLANVNGEFDVNPFITLKFPAVFSYYGIHVDFNGNPPKEIIIRGYNDTMDTVYEYTINDLNNENYIPKDFLHIKAISVEVTKGAPNDRSLISSISFSRLSDYEVDEKVLLEAPIGTKENRPKNVYVKKYTYYTDDDGNVKEQDDDVWFCKNFNPTGENKYVQNPLINTDEHAEMIATWIGNYYNNNTTYQASYRGDPKLESSDIVYLYSQSVNNLQCEIEELNLTFNGGFKGSINFRKAVSYAQDY